LRAVDHPRAERPPALALLPLALRRARQRALRAHHPPARVLPHARRGAAARRPRPAHPRARRRGDPRRARLRHRRQDATPAAGMDRAGAHALRRGGRRPRDARGIAGTYEQAFSLLRDLSPLVLLFLGSSIGNLDEAEVDELLDRLAAALAPGDHLLLGIDLVKDVRTLEAAYNDAAGVSAAFSKNLFARMNRELATGLDLDAIEHVAYFDAARSRIEIFARFTREAVIALPAQGRRFRLAAGEMVRVEISRKFEVADMVAEAERHGFPAVDTFVDPTRSFALLLLRRRG